MNPIFKAKDDLLEGMKKAFPLHHFELIPDPEDERDFALRLYGVKNEDYSLFRDKMWNLIDGLGYIGNYYITPSILDEDNTRRLFPDKMPLPNY